MTKDQLAALAKLPPGERAEWLRADGASWLADQAPTPPEQLPYAETLNRDNLVVAERRDYELHYWRRSLRRTRRAIYRERIRSLPRFLHRSRARRPTCGRRRAARRSSRSARAGPGEPPGESDDDFCALAERRHRAAA